MARDVAVEVEDGVNIAVEVRTEVVEVEVLLLVLLEVVTLRLRGVWEFAELSKTRVVSDVCVVSEWETNSLDEEIWVLVSLSILGSNVSRTLCWVSNVLSTVVDCSVAISFTLFVVNDSAALFGDLVKTFVVTWVSTLSFSFPKFLVRSFVEQNI